MELCRIVMAERRIDFEAFEGPCRNSISASGTFTARQQARKQKKNLALTAGRKEE